MSADVTPPQDPPAFPLCGAAADIRGACQGVADDLLAAGATLPSVYLLVGDRLRCFAARGYFQVVDGFPRDAGVIGRTVATGAPVYLPDVSADPSFIAAIPGLRGEICVPVRCAGEVVGAVNVESFDVVPPEWVTLLEHAAQALGDRICGLGGLPTPSVMQRLARAVVELTGSSDPSTLADAAVGYAAELSGMSSAALALTTPAPIRVTASTGPLAAELTALSSEHLTRMSAWVAAGTSSHYPGGQEVPPPSEILSGAGLRALAVHPLVAAGQPLGLLIVANGSPHPHNPEAVEAIELLAAQTATAIAAARILQVTRHRAMRDPLTGCRNMAAFTDDLESLASDRRGGACLIVDIDHFKSVNDTQGHPAGDHVLTEVVDAIQSVLRPGDQVYRLGGDEFAVLTTAARRDAVVALAERLLGCVRPVGVTLSIGYALVDTDTAAELRSRADTALYAAKAAGRDIAVEYSAADFHRAHRPGV